MKLKQFIKSILPNSIVYKYLAFCRKSYSQAGQDVFVFSDVFKKKRYGYFVEIGANNGITHNNTFLLESRFKWKGICVEANPEIYNNLIKWRKAKCINACIADKEGKALFKSEGLVSRIIFNNNEHNLNKLNNESGKYIELETTTLENIFEINNVPEIIDYLSMDIEGAEWLALKNFPFEKYRFNCITIERPNEELKHLLENKGYKVVKEIEDLDTFYIHQSFNRDEE